MKVRDVLQKLLKMDLDQDVVVDTEGRAFDAHLVEIKAVNEADLFQDGNKTAVIYLEV